MIITKKNINQYLSNNGETLDISDNKDIIAIEYLPDTLIRLYCHKTNITELPQLPDTLIILDTENTNLPKWQQVNLLGKEKVDRFRNKIKIKEYLVKL